MTHSKCLATARTRRVALAWLGLFFVSAYAQPTGLLYDPEPPVDSGYVRVMVASEIPKVSVFVDEKVRVASLTKDQVSDYLVVDAGNHQIALVAGKKTVATASIDVTRGSAVTVVFTSPDTVPHVFVDKASTNKLKAMLSVYQLASQNEPLDVLTGDGATKVFSSLAYGKSGAMQVNPISVALIATKTGAKTSLGGATLTMTQGGAYSIFLLPTKSEKVVAIQVQNKIERYTGK